MRTGRPPLAPLYVLPHGIEVIGEYAPNTKCPYWRVRIRPHPFFDGTPVRCNGYTVRRSRVMLAAKLGRPLTPQEHAHHGDEDRCNDTAGNLDLLTPAQHNSHHKTGSRHRVESRKQIGASLKRAYADRRRARPVITNRDHQGRIAR